MSGLPQGLELHRAVRVSLKNWNSTFHYTMKPDVIPLELSTSQLCFLRVGLLPSQQYYLPFLSSENMWSPACLFGVHFLVALCQNMLGPTTGLMAQWAEARSFILEHILVLTYFNSFGVYPLFFLFILSTRKLQHLLFFSLWNMKVQNSHSRVQSYAICCDCIREPAVISRAWFPNLFNSL